MLSVAAIGLCVYKKLEGNITAYDPPDLGTNQPVKPKVEGPKEPLNVLVLGSDNRDGTKIGGETPGLSDTTILLHLSADRKRAYGVSIPRDAMVERPDCRSKDGKSTVPGGLTQFNAAYAVGGPGCTIKTVQELTNIKIDHYVVINFAGFKDMVNAINGVKVCVPKEVNDDVGHIHLPAGTYKVTGEQALDYVRVRHDIGVANGDIGRMKRQQSFIAAMVEKVVSKGTLTNPRAALPVPQRRHQVADHRHRLRPPARAGLARQLAEEHRARQRPVHHRAQPGLRARSEPPPDRPGRREAVAQDPPGQAARPVRRRRRDPGPQAR